jgi:glutathione synthase
MVFVRKRSTEVEAMPSHGTITAPQWHRGAGLRTLVVMDDPHSVDSEGDTTMALVEELRARGHVVHLCDARGLSLGTHGLLASLAGRGGSGRTQAVRVAEYDVVLVRTDPPFDVDYLHATLLLEHVRDDCLLVNDPRALRDTNEKLFALRFPCFTPPAIVTSSVADLRAFMGRQGGRIVIKPLDGCGGQGIFVLDEHDPNLSSILESATSTGRRRVIGQRYLPAAVDGDKRIILLDGEPIGALLRRPAPGQARANIHAGGTAVAVELTARDLQIVEAVGERCRTQGLALVGLDVIGCWLTEINVTSPAGFRSITRLTGVKLETRVVDWLEDQVVLRRPLTAIATPFLAAA